MPADLDDYTPEEHERWLTDRDTFLRELGVQPPGR